MAESLPKLPGLTFRDVTKTKFNLCHQFDYNRGFQFLFDKHYGIGGDPRDVDGVAYLEPHDLLGYDSTLTYGRVKQPPLEQFIPLFARYQQKCLTFRAFFKQTVPNSPDEHYRVRKVNIIYFLEDDTIVVIEPPTKDAGTPQGKLIRRGLIPKNEDGAPYTWKDLNVGLDVPMYGKVFHIVDVDPFTKEYLLSQGIETYDAEEMPEDQYTLNRRMRIPTTERVTPVVDDKMRRLLEFEGRVLSFNAMWDDRKTENGEVRNCMIYYFLEDDTISVKEIQERNCGRDPAPMILKRYKLPKNWKLRPVTYPPCYLELTDEEVDEYYQPKDLLVGDTIFVLGRPFLLYDCDKVTRDYYKNFLNIIQKPGFEVLPIPQKPPPLYVPPHIFIGTSADTYQSCLSFIPKEPRKDVIRQLCNSDKKLRYEAVMDWTHPEDSIRQFVIIYGLAEGKIKISEVPVRNSGFTNGTFLMAMVVPKPGTDRDNPEYYTPTDFYIGAIIEVFLHRFKITGADLYVYRYMQANPDKFTHEQLQNMRNFQLMRGNLIEDTRDQLVEDCEEKRRAYLASLNQERKPPPTELELCYKEFNVLDRGPKPEPPPDYSNMSFKEWEAHMENINHPIDTATAKAKAAFDAANAMDTVCHVDAERFGIHVKQDCQYPIEPPREHKILKEKIVAEAAKGPPICPKLDANYKDLICPPQEPIPEPEPNICDHRPDEDLYDKYRFDIKPFECPALKEAKVELKTDFICSNDQPPDKCVCNQLRN